MILFEHPIWTSCGIGIVLILLGGWLDRCLIGWRVRRLQAQIDLLRQRGDAWSRN